MNHVLRFFTTTGIIVLGLFLIWFGLKKYGQALPPSTYQTPLVKELVNSPPLYWNKSPVASTNGTQYFSTRFENGDWIVANTNPTQSLKNALAQNPKSKILLEFDLNKTSNSASLKAIIDHNQNWQRIIFMSRADGHIQELRELSPKWTFTNGEVFLTRFLSLSSIGLESLLRIPSDVFFVHWGKLPTSANYKKLINEAKRQNKFVILGPTPRPLGELHPHTWFMEEKKITK